MATAAFETILIRVDGQRHRKVLVTLASTTLAEYEFGMSEYEVTDERIKESALSQFANDLEGVLHRQRLRVAASV